MLTNEVQGNQENMDHKSFLHDACLDKVSDCKTIINQSDLGKSGILKEVNQIKSIFPE